MSSALYGKGREKFLGGSIAWGTGTGGDTIRAQLVDLGAYTPSIDVDEFISDIPSGAKIGSPVTLIGKSITLGVADASDISFTGLTSAPTLEAIAIYKETGTGTTSPLIALIDTATGLPVSAGATQVDVAWSNGSNKIFKL